jgi:putative membrane protein
MSGVRSFAVLAVCASSAAFAHIEPPDGGVSLWSLLGVGLPLAATAVLYAAGVRRLSRRSASHAGVGRAHIAAFACGWFALAAALLPPLDPLGGELFSVHMIQHEILMLVAAPLLVLGRPLPVFLWAFPPRARERLARATRARGIAATWRFFMRPLTAWTLHAAALWIWHAPSLFDAALTDRALHDAQHLSFVLTALLFWSALLNARARESQGAAILYLFTTTIHTGVLGALITFASRPWYPSYLETAPHWGYTALEDQQLGGLIMWVPGSMVYIGFGLYLMARWILATERGVARTPRRPQGGSADSRARQFR